MRNPILIIAKKEILDNIRNKWVIIISVLFAFFALVSSYFPSTFLVDGWQSFESTIGIMLGSIGWIVPIVGIMLGYAAILGEIEKGSMSALIAYPTTKIEILLGKFLGLGGVLSLSLIFGFGLAGIVIAINISDANFGGYLVFIFETVLFGLVFLSLAMFFSNVLKKRSTAIGVAIFLWLFFILLLPMILGGILIMGVGIEEIMAGSFQVPEWYFGLSLFNPMDVYSSLVTMSITGLSSSSEIPLTYPSYYSTGLMVFILSAWIAVFQFLSYWFFNKKDM